MAVDITLTKLKYRNPNRKLNRRPGVDPSDGTWTYPGGKWKSKSSNQGSDKEKAKTTGTGVRRRAYGPW